jgi:hypothetical protein
MTPDSFVVLIYRRGNGRNREVAGVIQRTGSTEKRAFGSAEELWSLLNAPVARRSRRKS